MQEQTESAKLTQPFFLMPVPTRCYIWWNVTLQYVMSWGCPQKWQRFVNWIHFSTIVILESLLYTCAGPPKVFCISVSSRKQAAAMDSLNPITTVQYWSLFCFIPAIHSTDITGVFRLTSSWNTHCYSWRKQHDVDACLFVCLFVAWCFLLSLCVVNAVLV